MREEPIRVFISYAHKDERFRLELDPHSTVFTVAERPRELSPAFQSLVN